MLNLLPTSTLFRAHRGSRVLLALVFFALGACSSDDGGEAVADAGQSDTADTSGTEGDAGDDSETAAPIVFCDGSTRGLYDPTAGTVLGHYPDDYYLVEDSTTTTGWRVSLSVENAPWIESVPGSFGNNVLEMNDLDGWGTTAGVFFRFSGPVSGLLTGHPDSLDSNSVQLLELGPDGPTRIPYEVRYTDENQTVILIPLVPLKEATAHAAVWTTTQKSDDGKCIAPSAALQGVLRGDSEDSRLQALAPRYADVLEALDLRPDDISAMTVFTTQSVTTQGLEVAADIRSRSWAWDDADCTTTAQMRRCETSFTGFDYRDQGIFVDGTAQAEWTMNVSAWLPAATDGGPYPTVLYGHGIGGDRSQAGYFAEFFVQLGIAVMAIDAVAHNEHPGGSGGGGQADVIKFFGIDILNVAINGRELRDNWRQSAWDKLQLVTLLEDDNDVDGDGEPDVDLDRLSYMGVSLGGIMGPELMAYSDRLGAGVLDICGGRLTTIMTDSEQFGGIVGLLAPQGTEPGEVDRFFVLAQTLLERGDPANFAPHLLGTRLPDSGSRTPHVLMQIAIGDETIPNTASWYLARSLGTPQLPPVVQPVQVVAQETALPVSGNVMVGGDTAVTAGLFQLDRISFSETGPVQAAQHGSTPGSLQAASQTAHFLQTWVVDGLPEIIDTYAQFGTPPL